MRVTKDGDLKLSIPYTKKFSSKFKDILIEKWKQLLKKQKKQNNNKVKTITKKHVWIWWEKKEISSLPFLETMKKKNKIQDMVEVYLKTICLKKMREYADKYSEQIWYSYNHLKVKKVRSKRWSCSSKQNININLALVHLKPKFLEYVVAHEVCHLQHKHHQKKFWELVEKVYPNYKIVRKALRNMGRIED